MPPSLQQYKESLKHKESVSAIPPRSLDTAMGMLKTAAVSFDKLTQNEHWDRFLSMIEGKLEAAKREEEALLLLCGGAVGPALDQARLGYQNISGYIRGLEEAAMLPQQMMGIWQDVKHTAVSLSPQAERGDHQP